MPLETERVCFPILNSKAARSASVKHALAMQHPFYLMTLSLVAYYPRQGGLPSAMYAVSKGFGTSGVSNLPTAFRMVKATSQQPPQQSRTPLARSERTSRCGRQSPTRVTPPTFPTHLSSRESSSLVSPLEKTDWHFMIIGHVNRLKETDILR